MKILEKKRFYKILQFFCIIVKLYLHSHRLIFIKYFLQQLIQQLQYFVTNVQCLVFPWLDICRQNSYCPGRQAINKHILFPLEYIGKVNSFPKKKPLFMSMYFMVSFLTYKSAYYKSQSQLIIMSHLQKVFKIFYYIHVPG